LQYISTSNAYITIAVTPLGGSTTTSAATACTTTTCTVSFTATPGPNTLVFTLTDSSSNVLSTFTTTTIVQPATLNTLKFTANPVVNSVTLQLASSTTNAGTPANIILTVNAKDIDGNTIIGNANYVDVNGNPLSLSLDVTNTQAGGRGTVTLQGPTEITAPNQKTIYAHYDGNWLSSSTITVSSTSSAVTSLTSATLTTNPTILEYPLTLSGSGLWGITRGNNNDLWTYENTASSGNVSYVAELSTSGALLNEYATPTSNSAPNEGAFGSDGNLWITENTGGHIERITQSGVRTDFKVTGASDINYITAGPDGNIWATDSNSLYIIRMSTNGSYTTFSTTDNPGPITTGPDGNIWFTIGNAVDRMSTQGVLLNQYSYGTAIADIVTGPDGNMWFDDNSTGKVQCISVSGVLLHTVSLGATTQPYDITVGPDGDIWVTESTKNKIARISTAGTLLSTVSVPSAQTPIGITTGPDGNIWITEDSSNIVGKLVL